MAVRAGVLLWANSSRVISPHWSPVIIWNIVKREEKKSPNRSSRWLP